jgi:hypothetical protein
MIHASAIAESIVAPTIFRPEFSHSLDPKRTFVGAGHRALTQNHILANTLNCHGLSAKGKTPVSFLSQNVPAQAVPERTLVIWGKAFNVSASAALPLQVG